MTDVPKVTPASEQPTLEQQLARVAGHVTSLPRGPRAVLRRLRQHADEVPPSVFWAIVDKYQIERRDEQFWLSILPLMVAHEHRPGRAPGQALAAAGVKPARVERWLRYDRDRATAEARRLLSKIDSGFDWAQMGALLWWWNDRARRDFARQFFLSGGGQPAEDGKGDDNG